jgi:hypothetical protein
MRLNLIRSGLIQKLKLKKLQQWLLEWVQLLWEEALLQPVEAKLLQLRAVLKQSRAEKYLELDSFNKKIPH